jgi:hypothetical protein
MRPGVQINIRQTSGLGNQLFQYAAGLFFAERYGARIEVLIEPSERASSYGFPRPFLLSKFRITAPVRQTSKVDRMLFAHKPGLRWVAPVLRKAMGVAEYSEPVSNHYKFQPDLPVGDDVRILYLAGYWQSYRYVEAVEGRLRRELQFCRPAAGKTLELLQRIAATPTAVSLHVRRGDYTLAAESHFAIGASYTERAIAAMQERLPGAVFFVFSDDIAFCRKNLPQGLNAIFVDHNDSYTSYDDIRLMAACHHHIIANSTFSWWGAWLDDRAGKIVMAPRYWQNQPNGYFPDLLPPSWSLIDVSSTM